MPRACRMVTCQWWWAMLPNVESVDSHQFSDPKQKVQVWASTAGFKKYFQWRMSLEYHFEDIVQLKPNLNIFHGEKHVHFGYIRVSKKHLSWIECASIIFDQFLYSKLSVKMSEQAIVCTFLLVAKAILIQPQIPKSRNQVLICCYTTSSKLPQGILCIWDIDTWK